MPVWLTRNSDRVPVTLRAFATGGDDLAIDFHLARRPELTTKLLALCAATAGGGAVDPEFLLDMPVSLRICGLIALAATTDGSPLTWQLRCGSAACGQQNEFEIAPPEILKIALENANEERISIVVDGALVTLRRPTGRDQTNWIGESDDRLAEAMIRSIVLDPPLPDLLTGGRTLETISLEIEQAMDSFDPLLNLRLSVVCPECGSSTEASPDLTAAALERLSRAQRAAIADVHRLASSYHWSENEIIRLPLWRRRSYLELIEGGA